MDIKEKIVAFEYTIDKLIEWYNSSKQETSIPEDFDKLKVFKLLFFVTMAKVSESEEGLLGIFNNFVAMPYGPVEIDIYNNLDWMEKYKFMGKLLKLENSSALISFDVQFKKIIDDSIEHLKSISSDLINRNAFELVKISHKWYSWKTVYNSSFRKNISIPNEYFKYDTKFFK